jgi:hypothetical protein
MPKKSKGSRNRHLPGKAATFRPEDFAVGSIESRAAARTQLLCEQQRIRVIFHVLDEPLKLQTSTCERLIWPDGSLVEIVFLDGRYTDLTAQELDSFICQHPVVGAC